MKDITASSGDPRSVARSFFAWYCLAAMFLCAVVMGCASGKIPSRPEEIPIRSVDLELKKPEVWTLKNGLTVMYQENDELPLVEGAFLFRGGSLYQGRGRAGLAGAMGQLLREGGIEGVAPQALDQRLEALGAKIESQVGEENGTVMFSGLSSDFEEIFGLFSKVIQTPAFSPERLELWRGISLEGIRRRDEEPASIAQVVFHEVLYGLESPYAGISTIESVTKIQRDDLVSFYRSIIRPNGSILVITGAPSRKEVQETVERYFGKWEEVTKPLPDVASPPRSAPPGLYIVEKPFEQAAIYGGHFGPKRLSPDHYAISVFNRYFAGSSFGSVLFSRIRSQKGLAYAVDGGFNPGGFAGDFDVYVGTRVSEVVRALTALFEVIEDVRQTPPEEQLFDEVVDSAENMFVFQFTTAQAVAMRAALLQLLEYPKDYDETYISKLRSVSAADLQSVGERLVHPNELALTVVGNVDSQAIANAFGGRLPVYRVKFSTVVQGIEPLKPENAR